MLQHFEWKTAELIARRAKAAGVSWEAVPGFYGQTGLNPKRAQVPVVDDPEALYRRAESSLGVGAAVVGQGAALLHPAVESGVNVPVNIFKMRGELVPPEQLPAHEREH